MRIIGVLSGTSYDAIDVAAADYRLTGDGRLGLHPLGDLSVPYEPSLRAAIGAVLPPHRTGIADVCRLDAELGRAFGAAATRALTEICDGRADLVVSHGQTVFHWIDAGTARGTLQLGQPAWIAAATGLPVLADLRSADIAAGGQGAPLVPILDKALLAKGQAALNIGGIANITAVNPDGTVTAYDIGPGNALIDAAALALFGAPYDDGGRLAAGGTVLPGLLADLREEPYYRAAPPKSTGKELFHSGYLAGHLDRYPDAAPADVLATLTELTATVIAEACLALGVERVFASGGGVHNPVLMGRLAALAEGGFAVVGTEELGIPVDAKEAYAFTLLGWLSWHGLPGALPEVTGAAEGRVLGSWTPGAEPLRLPGAGERWDGRVRVGPP